ncbi:hypothetical protein D9M72_175570 [compost metagenome]
MPPAAASISLHSKDASLPRSHPFDQAGAVLRRHDRHALDGHPPRLRPLAAAHHAGTGVEPTDLLVRAGGAEPVVGHLRRVRGHAGRPLRRVPRADRRLAAVRGGPLRHGAFADAAAVHPERGRADRRGAGGLDLRRDLRRDRPADPGRAALVGHGRGRGGRLVRPVPDGAHRRPPDRRLRLADGAGRGGGAGAGDRAAGLRPARAQDRGPGRPP